ncbi:MAG TPA: acetate--CoA ligase family protein [Candidatus Acidoferrales bacterium]|nr:acetate--CoA ligase family protein [Candidatus Acidoferrales bacterium]
MKDFFYPKSIAVIGASRVEGKVGYSILKNLISSGFEGEIVPVNPNADEILGIKCSPHVRKVDLVVIVVPAKMVPSVLEESATLGIRAAIIISAGFREAGAEGALLEAQLKKIIKKHGIRVIGPNCLGIISTNAKMNASFAAEYPKKGDVSFVSQSGALCTAVLDWAATENIGFDKFVSTGNKIDITEADLLEYLKFDPTTKVVGLYIEGIKNGKEFMIASQMTSQIKPIIALKSGKTSPGARAASSHTGALAGSDAVYDAAFKQSGIIRVETVDEFLDTFKSFSMSGTPKVKTVAIITNAGGLGVLASDACADDGVVLANFTKETIENLRRHLPTEGNLYNPVDVLGDAMADRYANALCNILQDENVGSIIVLLTPQAGTEPSKTAMEIVRLSVSTGKSVITSFVGGEQLSRAIEILKMGKVPNFQSPERAVKAVANLMKYEMRSREEPRQTFKITSKKTDVLSQIDKVKKDGRITMSEEEGRVVLKAYEVRTPDEKHANSREYAVKAARSIGYPVVMKVSSPDISHKSDVGGVVVNIKSDRETKNAYESIYANINKRLPTARMNGVIIQKMIEGKEAIVGVSRDPQFGPFITFGLGGIYVEVLRDVSHRVAPITSEEAKKMITEIKSYPILVGVRGGRALDIDGIVDAILLLSQIMQDFDELQEIEINPLIVQEKNCYAIDALVVIRAKITN